MIEIAIYQRNEKILLMLFFDVALDENLFYISTKYGRNLFCIIGVYSDKSK